MYVGKTNPQHASSPSSYSWNASDASFYVRASGGREGLENTEYISCNDDFDCQNPANMLGATTILLEDKHLYNSPSPSGIDLTVDLKDLCLGADICGDPAPHCYEDGFVVDKNNTDQYTGLPMPACGMLCGFLTDGLPDTKKACPTGDVGGTIFDCLNENIAPLNEQAICAPRPYFFGAGGVGQQMYPKMVEGRTWDIKYSDSQPPYYAGGLMNSQTRWKDLLQKGTPEAVYGIADDTWLQHSWGTSSGECSYLNVKPGSYQIGGIPYGSSTSAQKRLVDDVYNMSASRWGNVNAYVPRITGSPSVRGPKGKFFYSSDYLSNPPAPSATAHSNCPNNVLPRSSRAVWIMYRFRWS